MTHRLGRWTVALALALVPVHAHAAPRDVKLRLRCGGDRTTPYWAMEFTASKGTCWMHGGHHTYFFGSRTYRFVRATGTAFSVEQMFSPPTEVVPGTVDTTPVWLESSLDGRTWTALGYAPYRLTTSRQEVRFDVRRDDAPAFRFLRIRQPRSSARGLSGFLDHTNIDVVARPAPQTRAPRATSRTVALTCETDLVEDFFAEHPCTFGGVNRYDAPSFFHTYFLGDGARVRRLAGSMHVGPWRTDDTRPTDQCTVFVQISVDGVRWIDAASLGGNYGTKREFSVDLPNVPARFVRLFPDYHPRYDDVETAAPLHHAKGYFLHSTLTVTGSLPPR